MVVKTRWGRIGFAICADMIYRRVWTDYRDRIGIAPAIGGGVKYFFNPHFGIRADGRAYSSYLGSETIVCGAYYTCSQTNWVTNFVANGGIVIAF